MPIAEHLIERMPSGVMPEITFDGLKPGGTWKDLLIYGFMDFFIAPGRIYGLNKLSKRIVIPGRIYGYSA